MSKGCSTRGCTNKKKKKKHSFCEKCYAANQKKAEFRGIQCLGCKEQILLTANFCDRCGQRVADESVKKTSEHVTSQIKKPPEEDVAASSQLTTETVEGANVQSTTSLTAVNPTESSPVHAIRKTIVDVNTDDNCGGIHTDHKDSTSTLTNTGIHAEGGGVLLSSSGEKEEKVGVAGDIEYTNSEYMQNYLQGLRTDHCQENVERNSQPADEQHVFGNANNVSKSVVGFSVGTSPAVVHDPLSNAQMQNAGIEASSGHTGSPSSGDIQGPNNSDGSSVDKGPEPDNNTNSDRNVGKNKSYAQAAGNINDTRRTQESYQKSGTSNTSTTAGPKIQRKPPMLSGGSDEEKMTIYFHTVLTPEFKFNKTTDAVVIRCSLFDWKYDTVDMNPIKYENGYIFMEGKLMIKPCYIEKCSYIQYKYCVIRKHHVDYEYIYKQTSRYPIINRVLNTRNLLRYPQEVWHQYDDLIQHENLEVLMKGEKETKQASWHKVTGFLKKIFGSGTIASRNDRLVLDRTHAVLSYLPTWEEFVCENHELMLPSVAIKQFLQVVKCMKETLTSEYNHRYVTWSPTGFSLDKILVDYLQEKIDEFKNGFEFQDVNTTIKRLALALSITHIVTTCGIPINNTTQRTLLHALALPVPCDLTKSQYNCIVKSIKEAFHPILNEVIESLASCVKKCSTDSRNADIIWILAIPMLHFLRDDSQPMKWPTQLDCLDYNDGKWWGHEQLGNIKYSSEQLQSLMPEICSLFEVDLLLQRTFLASLTVEVLVDIFKQIKFDFFVACNTLGRLIKKISEKPYMYQKELQAILQVLIQNIRHENEQCKKDDFRCDKDHAMRNQETLDVLLKSLKCLKLKQRGEHSESTMMLVSLFAASTDRCLIHSSMETRSKISIEKVGDKVKEVADLVLYHNFMFINITSITYWDSLFKVFFYYDDLEQIWVKTIYPCFQRFIIQNSPEDVVRYYCNTDFSNMDPLIEEGCSGVAFAAIDHVMSHTGETFLNFAYRSNVLPYQARQYGDILSHFVEKSFKVPQAMTLQTLLRWKPLAGFFKMLVTKNSVSVLKDDAKVLVVQAKSVMEDVITRLKRGTVTVEELQCIRSWSNQFAKLCEVMDLSNIDNIRGSIVVKKVVEQRKKELEIFADERIRVGILLTFCSDITVHRDGRRVPAVDIRIIQKSMERDVTHLKLDEIYKPATVETIISDTSIPSSVTFFSLSKEVIEMLPELQRFHLSGIFLQFWKRRVDKVLNQRQQNTLMTLDEVQDKVWKCVIHEWHEFCIALMKGAITLTDVDRILSTIKDDNLEVQFKFCGNSKESFKWISQRCKQIRLYRQIDRCLTTAQLILDIRTSFDLKGDFGNVQLLCSTGKKDCTTKCLNDIDAGVTKACMELENVTSEESNCLKILMKCQELIKWIKEEIKNMQELKVFVDLAMIQAGETDLEVDRVSCLHQASTGYGAFIFDLDDQADYEQLMKICRNTWTALRNDPKLAKKLEDTNRHIQWLKGIKESHGSVEVSSMRQVESINAGGIYDIGKLDEGESLRLRVPDENDEEKVYSLEHLKDLQSKLMLVAGKAHQNIDGKAQVARFVEVLDGAQYLEKIYHEMCASGNVLFAELKISLICDEDSKTPVYIDFCVKEHKFLFGKKQLIEMLKELCQFMERSLKQWYKYIDEKRDEYYHLNVLTTQQLVILRRALATFGPQEDVTPIVYGLLSVVKNNCNRYDLQRAIAAVASDIQTKSDEEQLPAEVEQCLPSLDFLTGERSLIKEYVGFWEKMDDMAMEEKETMAVLKKKKVPTATLR